MTVGDRDGNNNHDYDEQLAQKLDNDVGKIIHLTAEGSPAPDNPFPQYAWCGGRRSGPMAVRSPQGFVRGARTALCGKPNMVRAVGMN